MLTEKLSQWLMRSVPDFGISSICDVPITLGSDIGLTREENQDRVAMLRVNATSSNPHFVVVALADGMGGMSDGSECAARTLGTFFNALIHYRQEDPETRLLLAANEANEVVYQYSNANGGATLSAVLFEADHRAFTVNIGDSRIYATNNNKLEEGILRLTVDDSLEEAVGGHGKELLQFIGMGEGLIPHISAVPEDVDKIVITSDGVHFISHPLLSDILIHTHSENEAAEQLLTVAKWRGGADNASVASILTKGVLKSITHSYGSSIEVWDPFGSMQVTWVKQESIVTKEPVVVPKEKTPKPEDELDKPDSLQKKARKVTKKKPRNYKKRKVKKKEKQLDLEQPPQIEIDIEPIIISPNEDLKNDNS